MMHSIPDDLSTVPPGTYRVAPGVLAGPYPRARPTLAQLEAAGMTRRIDLTEGEHSISDFHVPTTVLMEAILEAIHGEMSAGGRVYVHCEAGLGRTGTVIGCLLAELDAPDPLARLTDLRRASGLGGGSPETSEQEQMVRDWVRRTRTDPLAR